MKNFYLEPFIKDTRLELCQEEQKYFFNKRKDQYNLTYFIGEKVQMISITIKGSPCTIIHTEHRYCIVLGHLTLYKFDLINQIEYYWKQYTKCKSDEYKIILYNKLNQLLQQLI